MSWLNAQRPLVLVFFWRHWQLSESAKAESEAQVAKQAAEAEKLARAKLEAHLAELKVPLCAPLCPFPLLPRSLGVANRHLRPFLPAR